MTGVSRIEAHPLSSWVVSVFFYFLCLSGSVSHFCWGRDAVKEGRWGCVDRSITVFHVWFDEVGEYWDKAEVGKVVEGFISDEDGEGWFTTTAHDPDGCHEVVSPFLDDIKHNGVSLSIT